MSEENDSPKLNENIKKEAEKGNKDACSFLAKNYSQDQEEPENTFKYMMICLKSGQTTVALEYAINLYKNQHYEFYGYGRKISMNHTIY